MCAFIPWRYAVGNIPTLSPYSNGCKCNKFVMYLRDQVFHNSLLQYVLYNLWTIASPFESFSLLFIFPCMRGFPLTLK